MIDEALDQVATKTDLFVLRNEIRAEINRALMIHTGIVITAMAVIAAIAALIVEVS